MQSTQSDNLLNSPEFTWSYSRTLSAELLDNRDDLETPEGAVIQLCPAGPALRGLAYVVDELFKLIILTLVILAFGNFGNVGLGISLLSFFLVSWFYGVLFEVFNSGQTPGKVFFKLRAINKDGTPIRFAASLLRNIIRFIDTFPFGIPALVCMVMSENFERLGDRIAGTMVVHFDEERNEERNAGATANGTSIPVKLNDTDRIILMEYEHRFHNFSDERAIELAYILYPIHKKSGQGAVSATLSYAHEIRGLS